MDRIKSLQAFVLVLVILAGTGIVLLIEEFDHIALLLLIPLMFAFGAVPIAMRIARGTFDLFEISVPYFVMFFLFYGASAIFVLFVDGVATDRRMLEGLDQAVAYCTLGFGCLMFGYWVAGKVVPVQTIAPGPRVGWIALAGIYTVGFLGMLTAATVGSRSLHWMTLTGLESLVQQLNFLATLALFYAIFLIMSKTASKAHVLLFFGWMLPTTLVYLSMFIGNKTQVILHFGLPFIAYWYVHRRVPWKSLIAFCLLVVFVLFPVYYTYRHYDKAHYSKGVRMEKALGELGKQNTSTYAENAMVSVAKRVAIIGSTAIIVRECGRGVDYQFGKTIWLGVIAVAVPRIIWPDKPQLNIGLWFGKTFRITGFYNYSYITISMVGELYWNFHVIGVVLGMFIFGVVQRALYARLGAQRGANPFRLSIYVVLLYTTILTSDGGTGGLQAGLTRQLLIMLLLERVLIMVQGVAERRNASASGGAPSWAMARSE